MKEISAVGRITGFRLDEGLAQVTANGAKRLNCLSAFRRSFAPGEDIGNSPESGPLIWLG